MYPDSFVSVVLLEKNHSRVQDCTMATSTWCKKKAKTWQISGYWMPQQNHWFHHEKRRFEDLHFLEIDLVPVLCQGPLAGIAAGRAGICCAVFRHISAVVFSLRRKDGHFFLFKRPRFRDTFQFLAAGQLAAQSHPSRCLLRRKLI